MDREEYLNEILHGMFGDRRPDKIAPCPFTDQEIVELDEVDEILVYVPAGMSEPELCERFGIRTNIDFTVETQMIRSMAVQDSHWFATSSSKAPEMLGRSGKFAARIYEDEGLCGLDLREYLCFCAAYRATTGEFPDQGNWTFLLAGSYDYTGVSVVGFDSWGNLSHHGWMRNFEATFAGSRYSAHAPRIEILPQTVDLLRPLRGVSGLNGRD